MEVDRESILTSFLVESEEGLQDMEQALLELEIHPKDEELIDTVFRVVHTIKGNAGIVDKPHIITFAHGVEDLLDGIRKRGIGVTPDIINLLLASLDVLREMITALRQGRDETSERAKGILATLAKLLGNQRPARFKKPGEENETPEPSLALPGPSDSSSKGSQHTLRVGMKTLDHLLDLTGEIAIARGRITGLLEQPRGIDWDQLLEANRVADSLQADLQETVLRARMVSIVPFIRQFSRTVRDLASTHGKLARLQVEGEEVEVDTSIIEHLKDPLLHMIRNAVDHGIEPPAVRQKIKKPPVGTITFRATHQGSNILIEVQDDGAGLDRQRIIETARKRKLATELDKLSEHDVFQLIFEPGFSTASEVSDLSGRGVGMDVVRRNVQALRGSVHITSQPGKGSAVQIRLPLTLAIIEGFGVGVGEETFVIPVDQVLECVELPEEESDAGRKEGVLGLRGQALPFLFLRDHFGLPGVRGGRQNIVVVQHDAGRVGLAVDALYGTAQTVIKPLPTVFKGIPGISGSAILGSGRVAMILDVPALLRDFHMHQAELV